MRFIYLLLLQICLFATDYDCIIVGTSPFSLFEALYQSHSGKKVLILEESSLCGGAWKSIEMCGIPHVDLGCHQIGRDPQLKEFLEIFAGCTLVPMDNPFAPLNTSCGPNGHYFSRGCFELIDNLLRLISATDIVLLTDHKVENIWIDDSQKIARVEAKHQSFTSSKVIVTPMSCLKINPQTTNQNFRTNKYYHLYLLIQDSSSPRFSYQCGTLPEVNRVMNLTHFAGLTNTGRQIIVIQTVHEEGLFKEEQFLSAMKKNQLIDESAFILKAEPYIYTTGSLHQGHITPSGTGGIVEVLQTGYFQALKNYIHKWKTALKPYKEIFP